MASEVKRAHPGILKILSSLRSLLSERVDLRQLVCAAFFTSGLRPWGCTKQLIEVEAGWSIAWTSPLQARLLAPQKIMRTPRRLFKSTSKHSEKRGLVLGRFDGEGSRGTKSSCS